MWAGVRKSKTEEWLQPNTGRLEERIKEEVSVNKLAVKELFYRKTMQHDKDEEVDRSARRDRTLDGYQSERR